MCQDAPFMRSQIRKCQLLQFMLFCCSAEQSACRHDVLSSACSDGCKHPMFG